MKPKAFDFTTLYTKLPHDKIFENMQEAITEARSYLNSLGNVTRETAKYVELQSTETLMEYVRFIVNNTYIANDPSKVLRQRVGIPMGTNCAPEIANLVLYVYEARYIDRLNANNQREEARKHKYTHRFIDDIITFNTEPIPREAYDNLEYTQQVNEDDVAGQISVIYLGARICYNEGKRMQLNVFDKAQEWKLKVLRYPSAHSNTPQHQTRGIYIGEMRRYQLMVNSIFAFKQAGSSLTRNMYLRGYSIQAVTHAWTAFMNSYGDHFHSNKKERHLRSWFKRMVRWAFHPNARMKPTTAIQANVPTRSSIYQVRNIRSNNTNIRHHHRQTSSSGGATSSSGERVERIADSGMMTAIETVDNAAARGQTEQEELHDNHNYGDHYEYDGNGGDHFGGSEEQDHSINRNHDDDLSTVDQNEQEREVNNQFVVRRPDYYDDTSDSEASVNMNGRPIRYQLRSQQQRASNIGLLGNGNSNGGSGQLPSVVRPVQFISINQRRSERSISPSSDSSASTANDSIDNREILNDEVGVTTIGELRQVNLPIIRDAATKWDKTRVKLFKYDSEITPFPEEENSFKNWWTDDLVKSCSSKIAKPFNDEDRSIMAGFHQRRRKNDDLLNNHGDYRFFCPVCWIRLFKDDHKRNVCQNTLRLREAAIQYGSENGFPDQE